MGVNVLRGFLLGSFFAASFIGFSQRSIDQPARVEIFVERIERVSGDEARFRVKVKNTSDRPVFLTGIDWRKVTNRSGRPVFQAETNDELGERLDPVYLDQWLPNEGWKRGSCIDTPPPHVIRLNPGEAITQEFRDKLPISKICKNPITQFEGKFRYRVEYFESEKQARAYVEKLFSPRWREARALVAVSEEFEIPPPPDPKQ